MVGCLRRTPLPTARREHKHTHTHTLHSNKLFVVLNVTLVPDCTNAPLRTLDFSIHRRTGRRMFALHFADLTTYRASRTCVCVCVCECSRFIFSHGSQQCCSYTLYSVLAPASHDKAKITRATVAHSFARPTYQARARTT